MTDATSFAALASRIARGLARVERDQVCCGDVSLQQFQTLTLLHEGTASTTGDVADGLGIDISTASRNLALLERNGYIARTRGKADARQITNALTRKGTRCVGSLRCDEESVFGIVFDRVPRADRRGLITALRVLADAVDADSSCTTTACCPAPTSISQKGLSP